MKQEISPQKVVRLKNGSKRDKVNKNEMNRFKMKNKSLDSLKYKSIQVYLTCNNHMTVNKYICFQTKWQNSKRSLMNSINYWVIMNVNWSKNKYR